MTTKTPSHRKKANSPWLNSTCDKTPEYKVCRTKKAHTIPKEHRLAFLSFIMKEDYNKYNAFATDALYNFHVEERIFKEIHHAQST